MPRYFSYMLASRRLKVGEYTFNFEVVDNVGGAWYGILELNDEKAAEALLTVKTGGLKEMTEAEYRSEKKKLTTLLPDKFYSSVSQRIQSSPVEGAAVAVIAQASTKKPAATVATKTSDTLISTGKAEFTDPLDAKMYAPSRGKKPKNK